MCPGLNVKKKKNFQWKNSFEMFSLNAGSQFLGKAKNMKIICLQLNNIHAKKFHWNGDLRFFHPIHIFLKWWKNQKSQFHWIFWAGKMFNCFFKAFSVSSSTRVTSQKCLIFQRSWWTKIFCIQWNLIPFVRCQNTKTRTCITNTCFWDVGL